MKRADLVAEHRRALLATRYDDLRPLVAAGISWKTIATIAPAKAQITVFGATYEPDADGGAAYLIPVRVGDALTAEAIDPLDTVQSGMVVDIVAIHPRHPSHWALRRDAAEWLGSIQPQYLDPEPVPIWRSPLGWLRGGCRGLTLLTNCRASQYCLLSGLGSIIAEDHRHAARLRDILSQPWSAPRVFVPQDARRAA